VLHARRADQHCVSVVTRIEGDRAGRSLDSRTREVVQYAKTAKAVRAFKTKLGCTLDKLLVARLNTAAIQGVIEVVAKGRDDTPGYPTKANHMLRYLRRTFGWGVRHGHCSGNPADGCKEVKERGQFSMPTHESYVIVLGLAKRDAQLNAHTKGSCPPYIWPAMEIGYLCRMRGIEVISLTDADELPEGLRVSRVKGSNDNVVKWTPRLRNAWNAVLEIRARTLARVKRPVPLRPESRYAFVSQTAGRTSKRGEFSGEFSGGVRRRRRKWLISWWAVKDLNLRPRD
jgi:hypothetical protein